MTAAKQISSGPKPVWPFEACLDSSNSAVRDVLEACEETFALADFTMDQRGTAQLVLAEVLNNIVEHAYLEQPGGEISVRLSRSDTGLCCKLTDNGRPMPGLEVPQTGLPDSSGELDSLPEGGFGWFLIRELTQNLTYDRKDGVNMLNFVIQFS